MIDADTIWMWRVMIREIAVCEQRASYPPIVLNMAQRPVEICLELCAEVNGCRRTFYVVFRSWGQACFSWCVTWWCIVKDVSYLLTLVCVLTMSESYFSMWVFCHLNKSWFGCINKLRADLLRGPEMSSDWCHSATEVWVPVKIIWLGRDLIVLFCSPFVPWAIDAKVKIVHSCPSNQPINLLICHGGGCVCFCEG